MEAGKIERNPTNRREDYQSRIVEIFLMIIQSEMVIKVFLNFEFFFSFDFYLASYESLLQISRGLS